MSPTGYFNEAANPPSSWASAPAPSAIAVTAGGTNTAARLRLEWADNSIANRWLQVIVRANPNTGLSSPAVLYMGHLTGEINGQLLAGAYVVSNADLAMLPPIGAGPASVTDPRDVNRDGFVLNSDGVEVRNGIRNSLILRNITIPAAGSAAEGAPAPSALRVGSRIQSRVVGVAGAQTLASTNVATSVAVRPDSLDTTAVIQPALSQPAVGYQRPASSGASPATDMGKAQVDVNTKLESVDDFFLRYEKGSGLSSWSKQPSSGKLLTDNALHWPLLMNSCRVTTPSLLASNLWKRCLAAVLSPP